MLGKGGGFVSRPDAIPGRVSPDVERAESLNEMGRTSSSGVLSAIRRAAVDECKKRSVW